MLVRAEKTERRNVESSQVLRTETMLANKATMVVRAREMGRGRQEKHLIRSQIQEDERVHRRRLEEQKQRLGVGD